MAKKTRADFSQHTKDIISARAAYRCCFPDCDVTLIGPGLEPNSIENIGECAHIYAAAPKGPRSNPNLSDNDLQKPENGIFLCKKHHALIDKEKGKKYPAEKLMLFKQMHEHKISKELGHISYPLMWLKKITIIASPILKTGVTYDFTKSTIITGGNSVGKTILIEYIYTALTGECLIRSQNTHWEICIELSNPVLQPVLCIIDNGTVRYIINNQELSFCPFTIDVIYLRDSKGIIKGDMINWIRAQLGKDRRFVKALVDGADLKDSYVVKKTRMETIREKPYETIRIKLQKIDDPDDNCNWCLEQFSETETSSVVFDLVIGYLRSVSRYKNTLFLLDWKYIHTFCGELMNHYFKLFHNSSNHFQTIAAMHTLWSGVDWSGWNLIEMTRDNNLNTNRRI